MSVDDLLADPPYGAPHDARTTALHAVLAALHAHHQASCPPYARIVRALWSDRSDAGETLEDLPWVPVGVFKHHLLSSVPQADILTVLHSSGTSGQQPSRIVLDRITARRQSRALAHIMAAWLGPRRRPMLLVESEALLRGPKRSTARAAGVLGMRPLGRDHIFALDDGLELRSDAVAAWLEAHRGEAPVIFGFTFMVWAHLLPAARAAGLRLDGATLVHAGGWKKLTDQAVDRDTFVATLARDLGVDACHDFYGMAEQVGSVFVECAQGALHTPRAAHVIVREPGTWRALPPGEPGVIQVLSALPTSYPGHSLLTEDRGVVLGHDACPCGRLGTTFRVLGRVPRAELRGCSDTLPGAK